MLRLSRFLRKDLPGVRDEDLLPQLLREHQLLDPVQVLLEARPPGAGPVAPEEDLVLDLLEPREVPEEPVRRDARDVDVQVPVGAGGGERPLAPPRGPPSRDFAAGNVLAPEGIITGTFAASAAS